MSATLNGRPLYTHDDLAIIEDIVEFDGIIEHCEFYYQLSEAEWGWLKWIGDRYSIASYLRDNIQPQDNDSDPMVVYIDVMDIMRCLAEEGLDRAPCLCEDTQLQRLIWYIGPDDGGVPIYED